MTDIRSAEGRLAAGKRGANLACKEIGAAGEQVVQSDQCPGRDVLL